MKFVCLIFTCKKNFYRIQTLRDTWIKDLEKNNIDYYFVSGDKDILEYDNHLLLNDFSECYEQLPLKTYKSFKASLNFNFDFLIKLDDDCFFNPNEFLKLDFSNIDYTGKFNMPNASKIIHFYKCNDEFKKEKPPTLYEYAEGGFYCLRRACIEEISSLSEDTFINTPENYRGEDVLVGQLLQNKRKLNLNTDYSKQLNMDITQNGISFHPVHMSLMHNLLNKDFNEQILILKDNPYKNEYNLRDLYLKTLDKNVTK
jgi:hypothetical protein